MAPLPGITRNRRSTPEHIQYITGGFGEYYDYDDDNSEEKTITTPPQAPLGPCPYDRCKHLEPECDEIQRKAGGNCLCPGLTGPNVLPDSPRLGQVVAGDRVASVSWCSPMSTVQGYIVMYGTPEGPLERGPILNATYRFYSIEGLLPNTPYKLCVVAFNDAGESTVTTAEEDESGGWERGIPRPCGVIRTSGSQWSHIYLGVGVSLAILTGIVGLAVLGYLLWRRKGVMRMKEDGGEEMGVQNQSYKADSVEQL
ncbi:LRRN4 C-terminal-like protein [Rhinophrynus dorsalis]